MSSALQVREEAGELCATLEAAEGRERAASEAADLLFHAAVLLHRQARLTHAGHLSLCLQGYWSTERVARRWCWQGVAMSDVMAVLRARQGVSGIAEKAARPPKQ